MDESYQITQECDRKHAGAMMSMEFYLSDWHLLSL